MRFIMKKHFSIHEGLVRPPLKSHAFQFSIQETFKFLLIVDGDLNMSNFTLHEAFLLFHLASLWVCKVQNVSCRN